MVRVLASQAVSPWRTELILDFEDTYRFGDVLAIAPYFGVTVSPEEHASWSRLSIDDFFERAFSKDLPQARKMVEEQAQLAKKRGLVLVAYEGGHHYLAPGSEEITALFGRAMRDPRMETLYDAYLRAFEEGGGRLLVHMNACSKGGIFGFWGAIEWLGQPIEEAPKLRALRKASERTRQR
ncbi:MAG: hypothetical protein N2515_04415 [Deltaproteobacteria bacterium]|nr:hypothetical protein [Deltaproteobacteria bacterium]